MRVLVRLTIAVAVAVAMLTAGLALALNGAGRFAASVQADDPQPIELSPLAQRSVMYAVDGTVMTALYDEDRTPVPLDQVPPVLQNAVLAVEDASFWEHEGISIPGIFRAAKENVAAGGIEEGGSTITQQLVKKSLLDDERTFDRKIREAVLALQMEDELSKEQILERYLNTVYFGQGAYGVRTAMERFFGKRLQDVTAGEAALLAGLISSPATFDPFANPGRARQRRAHALNRMVEQGYITQAEAEAAKQEPLPVAPQRIASSPKDYFAEEVLRLLMADPRLGATVQERYDLVFRGGLRIYTTLDPRMQRLAEQAVRDKLPPSEFTAALASIDPRTGAVKAVVGGPNFEQAQYNLVTQGHRQVGSAFKPIALAAWIDAGHSPLADVDFTAPCSFPMPEGQPPWTVNNYGGGMGGHGTLLKATINSYNCPYARLSMALGPHRIADMARRLGVSRNLQAVPSIVLGTAEVTPLELATIYATFAADGVRHRPMFITRVEKSDGTVLFENQPVGEQVIDPHVARTVSHVLGGVILRGTGRAANIGRPAAGKTGTNQEYRDAWFAGYTPDLATVVWMGHPQGQVPMWNVGGRRVTGGSYPAQMWQAFMAPALDGVPHHGFPPVDTGRWPPPGRIGAPPPPPGD